MEINQHNFVSVEEKQEEEEQEEALHRKKLSTANGIEFESQNNGVEQDSKLHNGDAYFDSDSASGIDFQSPNQGIQQEIKLQNSVYFDKNNGIESIDGVFEMKNGSITSSTFRTNSGDADFNARKNLETGESLIADMNYQCRKNSDSIRFSDSSLTTIEESLEEQIKKAKSVNNETKILGDFDSSEEIDQEETELDVEKVLEKQNTHDLYCPNCNSCITRRVILSRKRKVRKASRKPKYNKVQATFSSELDADSSNSANVQGLETVEVHSSDSPPLAASKQNSDSEPEVFRCLSCFSFFIPTGDGFKLFRLFGDSNDNENVQNLQKTPETNTHWFVSIFKPNKKVMAVEQGETVANQNGIVSSTASPSLGLVICSESQKARKENLISPMEDNKYFENVSINAREKSDNATVQVNAGIPVSGETALGASLGPLQGGVNGLVSLTFESLAPKQSPAEIDKNSRTASIQNGLATTVIGNQFPMMLSEGALLTDSDIVHHETRKDAMFSSSQATLILEKETTGMEEAEISAIKKKDKGHDVIVIVETGKLDPCASQTGAAQGHDASIEANSLLQSGTQVHASERRSAGISVDILKSIIYGGLIESITSLGVVSSAAGAGSATLNILALGLANLIGGLFIIGHNLIELKNDTSSGSSNQTNEREDRYHETLGRREKFTLHATVAILSFIIFGMLAPVVYGFSFRKSDDKDLKLAVVGGASLVCILLLAIGKAHVRRPPKSYISTALYYVSIGIMASGISYVVGDLISKLMEKVGWFESSLAVTMIVPERKPVELARASY